MESPVLGAFPKAAASVLHGAAVGIFCEGEGIVCVQIYIHASLLPFSECICAVTSRSQLETLCVRVRTEWVFLSTSLRPGRNTASLSWFLWVERQALHGRDPHPPRVRTYAGLYSQPRQQT